jgi:predicted nucleic acid-binding protein
MNKLRRRLYKRSSHVIDSNILVSICSREPTHQTAKNALADYAAKGWRFYSTGAILTEVLYILCKKLQDGLLIEGEQQRQLMRSTTM